MKKRLLSVFTLLFSFVCFGQTIDLELFADGFTAPTEIARAHDDRLFVVEQGGLIKILNSDGTTNATPFLDISNKLSTGGERGLLGLAFHPDYTINGAFYVNYTNTSGNTVIAQYNVTTGDASIADSESELILMTIPQPFSNHNGGCIRFGPDGYLYISMGDGGSGGDPEGHGQNINTLLGAMLRIDVNVGALYGIPEDNPFAETDGADEIWAYGLRNAWKFSFDSSNGDIWIADVGQNEIEEINKMSSDAAGVNYGWRCFEGTQEYNSDGCSLVDTYVPPVAEYTHSTTSGCSITGGYVYRGSTYPGLQGMYIFSDFCSNQIGMVDSEYNITFTDAFSGNFTTFGEDINGELYVAGGNSGEIYSIVDTELSTNNINTTAFKVYPNPANNVVTIQSGNAITATHAKIYDMGGKLLLSQKLTNSQSNMLSVAALPSGLYILNITGGNGYNSNHKLSVE